MTIYDITRPISPSLAVWPGDTPYSHTWTMRIADGESVNLSTLTFSAHTGTHADAPYHYDNHGRLIASMPLDAYIGPAMVIELPITGPIHPEHLAGVNLENAERLLIHTPASNQPDDQWHSAIAYPTPETIALLGKCKIRLFGTDAPSVDPLDSKTLDAHRALHRHDIAILETLQLRAVPAGRYELIALPLALPTDGSPVRAILRTLP